VASPRNVRQAATELEQFFDLSIDLLCVVGFDGYFKRVNSAWERTLGYSREELFERTVFDITHPDDIEPARQALGRLAEGSDLVGFTTRVVTADGGVRWVEWNTRTVPEHGVVYGVGRDATERRQAEAALREAHALLETGRDELRELAEQQAALRRVATLVAQETATDAVFAAVTREVGQVLGVDAAQLGRFDPDGTVVSVAQWGRYPGVPLGARFPLDGDSVSARVLRTGLAARMDRYEGVPGVIAATLRELGIRFAVGVPVSVTGRTWGVMTVTTKGAEPFPPDTESRLQDFTDLLATAIANAGAHERVRVLAEEQAGLRRVATLVAQQPPQEEVFAVIAEEIGRLLAVDSIEMVRFQDDRAAAFVAGWGSLAPALPVGTRVPLGGRNVASLVFRTRRAARLDDYYESASGPIAERLKAGGVRAAVATPIVVEGRLWGAMLAASAHDRSLPSDTESRIGQFTELMATAIANAEARAEVTRLADEQAALRRVATLVARGAPPPAVFDAATAEVSRLVGASGVTLARYEDDGLIVLAHRATDTHLRVGQRVPMQSSDLTATVARTGRTARRDDAGSGSSPIAGILRRAGVRSTVAAPVVVDGRTWGVLAASWTDAEQPPEDTEERMAGFAELLDTAIANADSRDQLTASRARVLAAGDDARRRVVRDLHDGAQQRLVHTIVTLKLARRALAAGVANAESLLAEALENAERANAEVRELAHGILPFGLTRGGLRAGVQDFVERLELPVEVEVSTGRLARDIEASAYFIVAEALTNVVKHARASRATVRAAVEDGSLRIEVADDGRGGADPRGYGLLGIADRVAALGGKLDIDSGGRGGTVLIARLPLSS
jgi:PAS domain S-box-containing protein